MRANTYFDKAGRKYVITFKEQIDYVFMKIQLKNKWDEKNK
jgi:hypothetical protein